MALGLALGLPYAEQRSPAASAAVPGASPTVFSVTPDVHYHPHSQSGGPGYTKSGSQVTACPDLGALSAAMNGLAADGSTVIGPTEITDGAGIKAWKFENQQAATISNALSAIASRGYTVVAVVRMPHNKSTVNFLNPRFAAYTDDSNNTAANGSIGLLRATSTSGSALFMQGGAPAASTNATDCYKVIPGAQLHVQGIASRTTANGGTRLYMNNAVCDVAQQSTSVSGYLGGIIAGTVGASNTANIGTSTNNAFVLYELAIWRTGQLNAVSDVLTAAAVSNYNLADHFDMQIMADGDSILDGIPTSLPTSPAYCQNWAMLISEPGTNYIPKTCRVNDVATSGNKITDLTARRDSVASWASALALMPGGPSKNQVFMMIGRNDLVVTATTAPILYASIVAYWHATTVGLLERGWSGYQVGNISGSTVSIAGSPPEGAITLQQRIVNLRALLLNGAGTGLNTTFLNDITAGPAQAFDGLMGALPFHKITVSGVTIFDPADTGAGGYFDTDQTHLRVAGHQKMVDGGDTPQYGIASIA